jgi:hypothetical protein
VKVLFGRSSDFRIIHATALPKQIFSNSFSGMQWFVPGYSGDHHDGFTPSSLFMLYPPITLATEHTDKGLHNKLSAHMLLKK